MARQGQGKRTLGTLRSVAGSSRAGRWEAGPRKKNLWKVQKCSREQSREVGGWTQGKELVKSAVM